MKTIPVATFNDLPAAQALRDVFQKAGVKASIRNESKLERLWFISEPLAAIHVDVDRVDFLQARQLLQQWEKADANAVGVVHCPECGSSRVEFPQITRKFLMPMVQALFMSMHLIPREYYCEDCHFTWPKEKPVEPERDILNFPINSEIGVPNLPSMRSLRQRLHRKPNA